MVHYAWGFNSVTEFLIRVCIRGPAGKKIEKGYLIDSKNSNLLLRCRCRDFTGISIKEHRLTFLYPNSAVLAWMTRFFFNQKQLPVDTR